MVSFFLMLSFENRWKWRWFYQTMNCCHKLVAVPASRNSMTWIPLAEARDYPWKKEKHCLIHEVKTKGYDASCVYIISRKLKMSLTGPILFARSFQMDNICHLCSLPLVLYVRIVTSRHKGFCSARIWKLRIRHLGSILSLGARNLASAELLV